MSRSWAKVIVRTPTEEPKREAKWAIFCRVRSARFRSIPQAFTEVSSELLLDRQGSPPPASRGGGLSSRTVEVRGRAAVEDGGITSERGDTPRTKRNHSPSGKRFFSPATQRPLEAQSCHQEASQQRPSSDPKNEGDRPCSVQQRAERQPHAKNSSDGPRNSTN